jgi:hypothetical protein
VSAAYSELVYARRARLTLIRQWDRVFDSIANKHPDTDCGVFFCGPPVLSKQLHEMSNKYTSPMGCRFFFGKEVRVLAPPGGAAGVGGGVWAGCADQQNF